MTPCILPVFFECIVLVGAFAPYLIGLVIWELNLEEQKIGKCVNFEASTKISVIWPSSCFFDEQVKLC